MDVALSVITYVWWYFAFDTDLNWMKWRGSMWCYNKSELCLHLTWPLSKTSLPPLLHTVYPQCIRLQVSCCLQTWNAVGVLHRSLQGIWQRWRQQAEILMDTGEEEGGKREPDGRKYEIQLAPLCMISTIKEEYSERSDLLPLMTAGDKHFHPDAAGGNSLHQKMSPWRTTVYQVSRFASNCPWSGFKLKCILVRSLSGPSPSPTPPPSRSFSSVHSSSRQTDK